MRSFRARPVGWRHESYRHYLAAKGIRTRYAAKKYIPVMMEGRVKFLTEHEFKKRKEEDPKLEEASDQEVEEAIEKGYFKEKGLVMDRGVYTDINAPRVGNARYVRTYDEEYFPDWSKEAQEIIDMNRKKGKNVFVIHRDGLHHMYEDEEGLFAKKYYAGLLDHPGEGMEKELRERDIQMKQSEVLQKLDEAVRKGELTGENRNRFIKDAFAIEAEWYRGGGVGSDQFNDEVDKRLDTFMHVQNRKLKVFSW